MGWLLSHDEACLLVVCSVGVGVVVVRRGNLIGTALGSTLIPRPPSGWPNASCGTSTRPTAFMRFLPSFCFSTVCVCGKCRRRNIWP